VTVGVFPECEEVFVSGERTDAGGIGSRLIRGYGWNKSRRREAKHLVDDSWCDFAEEVEI
jgi:hypothetical protein